MDSVLYFQFTKIYRKNVDHIYRFCYLKLNSSQLAEDFTSDVFLRFWGVLQEKGALNIKNPRAFLYRTARNLVVDYYRQKPDSKTISLEGLEGIIDPSQDLGKKEAFASDMKIVQKALSRLSDDYQDIIFWHYLDNMKTAEISQILNKSENAVRVMLHRAMSELKKEVNGV